MFDNKKNSGFFFLFSFEILELKNNHFINLFYNFLKVIIWDFSETKPKFEEKNEKIIYSHLSIQIVCSHLSIYEIGKILIKLLLPFHFHCTILESCESNV